MKILLFSSVANRHTHRWASWLAGDGHNISIISDQPPRADLDYAGVKIHRPRWTFLRNLYTFKVRGGPYANNRYKWRVYREIIEREKPDVINAHEALVNGPTLAHFPHFPRVLTPWGPDVEGMAKYRNAEEGELVRQAMNSADLITCNAVGLQEHWERLTGVSRERFRFFSWGTDVRLFHPRSDDECAAVRRKFQLPEGPILLSPRLAQPYYQIDLLMNTWTQTRRHQEAGAALREGSLVVLRAGADDGSWQELQRLQRTLNDQSIVMVDARLDPEEMATFYSISSGVAMLPKTDLLSMSLLESMACGGIPIVLRQPQNEAVVAEPDAPSTQGIGFLCDEATLGDALLRWSQLSEEVRQTIGTHNAAYTAKKHDWNLCARRTVDVYTEAIELHRRRRDQRLIVDS